MVIVSIIPSAAEVQPSSVIGYVPLSIGVYSYCGMPHFVL